MARSVGSIEVTVDADTRRLKAQVVRGAKAAGEAGGEALEEGLSDVDGRELIARLRVIRERAQQALAGIAVDLDVDARGVQSELRRLEAQLRATEMELFLSPEIDDADLRAELSRARAQLLDALEAPIDARLSREEVSELAAEANALLEAAGVTIEVGIEIPTSEEVELLAEVERIKALAEATGDIHIGVDLEVDRNFLANQQILASMRRAIDDFDFDALGTQGGTEFGSAFSDATANAVQQGARGGAGIGTLAQVAGGAVAIAIQPLAVAIQGLAGSALAVISSAFSALAAGALAAGPALAGVAASMGVITLASSGLQEAIDGDAAALAKLPPEARDFVAAINELRPAFEDLRRVVQQRLFSGIGDELRELTEALLPDVQSGLFEVSGALNRFFDDLSATLQGTDIRGVFDGLVPVIDNIGRALNGLLGALGPFLTAAAPAAERLTGALADAAQRLAELVEAGEGSGAINEFLQTGLDSLAAWVGLLGDIGGLLFTVFDAGREAGDGLVDSLAGVVEGFDEWLSSAEGAEAIAGFFEDSVEILKDFGPILAGIVGFFDRIVTPAAIDRFGQITDIIGDLLPVLGTLLDLGGRVLDPFIDAADIIIEVLGVLVGLIDKIPDGLKDFISPLNAMKVPLKLIAELIELVVEGFERLMNLPVIGWLDDIGRALPFVGDGVADVARELLAAEGAAETFVGGFRSAFAGAVDWAGEVGRISGRLDLFIEGLKGIEETNPAPTIEETEEALKKLTAALEAIGELRQIESGFATLERNADALERIFALGNAPLEFLSDVQDIEQGIRDLAEFIDEDLDGKIPNIFNPDDINADDFLTKIENLRAPIQEAVTNAFAGGGAPAARQAADDWVARIVDQLDGALSAEEVENLIFPGGIEATIQVAVDESSLALARERLEVLAGLESTPLTATLQIALDAGLISPDAVQAIVNQALRNQGIPVPVNPEITPDEIAEANAFLAANPLVAPAGLIVDPNQLPTVPPLPVVLEPQPLSAADVLTMAGIGGALGAVNVPVDADTTLFDEAVDGVQGSIGELNSATAAPAITLPTYPTIEGQIEGLMSSLNELDQDTTSVTITLPEIRTRIAEVDRLGEEIEALRNRTITITTDFITQGGMTGRILPGGMAGRMITSPGMMPVGERGYTEALIPLQLPLNRVDPSVRQLAELLRGEGSLEADRTPQRIVNNYLQVTPLSADPEAVATSVINRAAALASR